jgi:hypothetical protein
MSDGADLSEADEGKPRAHFALFQIRICSVCERRSYSKPDLTYLVQWTGNMASLWILAGDFDALLLCFSLSEGIPEKIARQFQQSCAGKPIISVGRHGNGSLPRGWRISLSTVRMARMPCFERCAGETPNSTV